MTQELPRGTVTFLLSDVEGSTELLKTLGADRYHDVLVDHHALMTRAIAEAGGRVIDTQGDAFFAAFGRAREAVLAAVSAQRAHTNHAWPAGGEVRVRMGLDTGEPAVGDERYVGLGIHRAARIMAAGHGGQVLLSGTTSDLVHDDLPSGVALKSLGEQRLKDLDRPVAVFQVEAADLPTTFPELRTLDAGSRSQRRRRHVLAGAIGVLVVAAVVAVVLVTRGGGGGGRTVDPNAVGLIDPNTNSVVGQIPVGIRPGGIDAGAGSVWVANGEDKTLSRIDANTRAVVRTIPLDATPTDVAEDERAVWVAEGPAGAVARIDPQFNTVTETIPNLAGTVRVSGGDAGTVAVGDGSVWAAFGSSPSRGSIRNERGRGDRIRRPISVGRRLRRRGRLGREPREQHGFALEPRDESRRVDDLGRSRAERRRHWRRRGLGHGYGGQRSLAHRSRHELGDLDPRRPCPGRSRLRRGSRLGGERRRLGRSRRIDPVSGAVIETIQVGGKPVGIAVGDGLGLGDCPNALRGAVTSDR